MAPSHAVITFPIHARRHSRHLSVIVPSTPSQLELDLGLLEKAPPPALLSKVESTLGPIEDISVDHNLPDNGVTVDNFPDGGFAAWSVVAGAWCASFCTLGWVNTMGTFQTQYERNQLSSYSSSTIAWILSLETFMIFAGAPIAGKIFDSHGPHLMLIAGTAMHVTGLIMTSLSKEYYQFILAQSVCSGIGTSTVLYASLNSISTWFRKRRATAIGIALTGSGVGGVVTPIMFEHLITRVGFGWALRAVALLFLGLLVIPCITVRSRFRPKPTPWAILDFIRPVKETRFLILVMASAMFHIALFLPANFIILQASSRGMSSRLASYLIATLNAGSVAGRIVFGLFADRVGAFNSVILCTSTSSLLVLALWLHASNNAAIIAFSVLIGCTTGAIVSVIPACVAQVADIRRIGQYTGANALMNSIGGLLGNPIGGALIAANGGNFTYMQIFAGAVMLTSTALFLAARTVQVGLPSKI